MNVIIFLIELIILFFISRYLLKQIFSLLMKLTRNRTVAVTILILITFPGTVIHELAHLFTAEILGVRTGKLSLVPESIREEQINTGSVQVAETDPVRRSLIGVAPVGVGIVVLTALSYFLTGLVEAVQLNIAGGRILSPEFWILIGLTYALFAVSNTMFASEVDMKGVWPVFIILGLIFAALYLSGFRLFLTGNALSVAEKITSSLVASTGLVLILNLLILGGTNLLLWIQHPRR